MSKVKKVGIVGWKTGDNSFGATIPYLSMISNMGATPLILSPSEEVEDVDLLILPGGMDINPATYNAVPSFHTSNTDVFKQYFMEKTLAKYIERKIPIFGICLGLQQIAVHFGGSMDQHFNSVWSKTRDEETESLDLNTGVLQKMNPAVKWDHFNSPKNSFKVNSLHHQAVTSLPSGLIKVATSKYYGNVEALIHESLPIAAVQWHPEELVRFSGYADLVTTTLIKTITN